LTTGRSGSFCEREEDLARLRKPSLALLREHEPPVGDDVELALVALDDLGGVLGSVDLGRETRGPAVIAASDGAVEDANVGHATTLPASCRYETAQAHWVAAAEERRAAGARAGRPGSD
jgi:hypothetical protein